MSMSVRNGGGATVNRYGPLASDDEIEEEISFTSPTTGITIHPDMGIIARVSSLFEQNRSIIFYPSSEIVQTPRISPDIPQEYVFRRSSLDPKIYITHAEIEYFTSTFLEGKIPFRTCIEKAIGGIDANERVLYVVHSIKIMEEQD